MSARNMLALGVGILLGGTAALLIRRRAAATPEIPEDEYIPPDELLPPIWHVPSKEEIQAAQTLHQLDDYYVVITWFYQVGHISYEEYLELYDAYEQRFYELQGGS